jgi:hypothetical protein
MFRHPILGGLLGFLVCWGNMFTQIGGRVGYMAQLWGVGVTLRKQEPFGLPWFTQDACLVGGLEHVLFSIMYGIILPID